MLDTDFIIAVLRGNETAKKQFLDYVAAKESLCMSTITVFELLRGVQRGNNPQKDREAYADATSIIYPIDITYIEADLAAKIDAHLGKMGTPIGLPDMLIAATCISTDQTLITRNAKHFEKIPGLKVETW